MEEPGYKSSALGRAKSSANLLQPLVWSDWVGLFSLKGFFHASFGTCWSIRQWWEEGQLEPWVASFTCCTDVHTEGCMWEPQKEHQRAPGGGWGGWRWCVGVVLFLFCCVRGIVDLWISKSCAALKLYGHGWQSIVWWRFHRYLLSVREGKPGDTAWSHYCWIPSNTALLAALSCTAR